VGSIAAWSLGITDVDPVKYELLFERFLNPERVSMPDFDIDFCQSRRGEVVEYVLNKYGKEKVASIMTFGTLQARAVLKDVGRVMQIPYFKVDEICKLIPFNALETITLEKAIAIDPKLQEQRLDDPDIQKLIDISLVLEGLYRHTSTHAAGIIIANENILETAPVYRDENSNIPVVALNMNSAQKMGFVKFDFLGLKTLTTIAEICKLVKKHHDIDINIRTIPLDDEETFALLRQGKTKGIFQLEAPVPRETLQKIQVDKFEEIVAITSLNRPGPMENIPIYIKCKADQNSVNYMHDALKDVLQKTYGVIIYQEQVMQVAQILSNYSLAAADLLRRAMGKKDKAEMELQKKDFIEGAKQNGVEPALAQNIFETVAKFAGYGFNRSHAVAYSVISFQAAYLKAHFLVEFYIGTLNLDINSTEKINDIVGDIQKSGIKMILPDVNKSEALFTREAQEKAIIYSLSALKSMSLEAGNQIVKARSSGPFTDIFDFVQRCSKVVSRKQVENLIKSGCFDKLHASRKQLIDSLDIIMKFANSYAKEVYAEAPQQELLFSGIKTTTSKPIPKLVDFTEDYPASVKISLEFEAIGFYLGNHPLDTHRLYLESMQITSSGMLDNVQTGATNAVMAGVIVKIRQKFGKRGRFAIINLVDLDGPFEVTIFNDGLITQHRELLREGSTILISAFIKRTTETGVRISVNNICGIEDTKAASALILRNSNGKYPKAKTDITKTHRNVQRTPTEDLSLPPAVNELAPNQEKKNDPALANHDALKAEYFTIPGCQTNVINNHISIKFHSLQDSLSFIMALEELPVDGGTYTLDIYIGDKVFSTPKKYKMEDIKNLTTGKPH
jgi:DNA polymerase III subunit alpha